MRAAALLLLLIAASAFAQDAERGQRLFNQTAAVTGRPVANCASCHADPPTLRALLANRLVAAGDAKSIRLLLQAAIAARCPARAARRHSTPLHPPRTTYARFWADATRRTPPDDS